MRQPALFIIFFTVFIDLVGFGIILPLLPYYAESLGGSPLAVGLLSTSYSLMQFLFTPVWGRLSDRHGRRPLILVSLAGSCAGFLVFGLARNLTLLFAARIVSGIAGAIIPTTQAYIADITTPENRARGMGLIGAAFGLGFIFGPAIGGLLSPYGYDKPGLLASAMAGANFLFALFMLPESLSENNRNVTRRWLIHFELLSDRSLRSSIGTLLLLFFVVTFAFSNMEATFGLLNAHRYELSARQTGYLFTYIGVLLGLVQGALVGRLVRHLGESLCVSIGIFSMVMGLTLMPFAPDIFSYCGIIALLAFGTGINNPCINSMLSRKLQPDEQGGVMGIAQSMSSLGRILGPIWGGYSFGSLGFRWPFLSAGMFMFVAFLLSLRNLRKG